MIDFKVINNFLIYLIDIFGFLLAVWIFWNSRKEKVNKVFSFLIISVLSWITFYHFASTSNNEDVSLIFFRVSGGSVFIFFIFYYLFVVWFLTESKFYEFIGKIIIICGSFFSFLTIFTDLIIKKYVVNDWGLYPDFSLFGWIIFYGYVIVLTLLINKILLTKFILSEKKEKLKIQYFIIGFILFAGLNFIFNVLFPVFFNNYQLFQFGNYSTIFLIVFTAYAIVKQELMGIKTLVTQVLIVAISIILLVDVFFLSDNPTMQLLKLGILLAFLYFSREMVVSVKKEKEAREELEKINKHLKEKTQDLEALLSLNEMISVGVEIEKSVQNIIDAVPEKLGHLGIMGTFLIRYSEEKKKAYAYITTETALMREAKSLLSKPKLSDYNLTINVKGAQNHGMIIKSILNNEIEKGSNMADFISPPLDRTTALAIQKKLGGKTFVSVPMTIRGKKKGALVFIFTKEISEVNSRDMDLMRAFVNHIGISFDNATLFNRTVNQVVELKKTKSDLEQANVFLKELIDIKTDFLHIVSHQLRTPLTALRGFISMWEDGDFDSYSSRKIREVRKRIVSNVDRLNNLVNDMVVAMENEGGDIKMDFQPVDVEALIKSNIDMMKPIYEKRGLYLRYKKENKKLPKIEADGKYLSQVFMNLTDNAEKYTKKGGLNIKIERDRNDLKVLFIDTGIGVGAPDKKRLFKKFSRGVDSNRVNPNGSGLGLFIIKQIIDKHHGKIEFESEGEDKGTTFTVTLPIVQPQ